MNSKIIKENLQTILPSESIYEHADDISAFQVFNPILDTGKVPTHVVRPKDVGDVQKLICLANEKGLNLTVSGSRGKHVKGGFTSSDDNIMIDLSSWKGIDWINRRNRVCLIQPGVTYGELLNNLESHGMTISMPLAPRNGKSVLAAVLDREPSTWPNKQWDISDPVGSTEFIFGNGELFRTGAAGGPGSLEKQRAAGGAQKCPLGPSQTDFHRVVQGAQGSMGIVTWITLRTELKPHMEKPYLLGGERLDKLIPFVFEVQRPWLGEHSFILDRTALAMLMGGADEKTFKSMYTSLPEFICLQNIAGFERLAKARVQYQETDIQKIAKNHGLKLSPSLGSISAENLLKTATSTCGEADWRFALKGHCLSIFFLSTLDKAPGFINIIKNLSKKYKHDEKYTGTYIQPIVQNHACHMEFLLPYDPDNRDEVALMHSFEKEAIQTLMEGGAFFSRPYGPAEAVFKKNPHNFELLKKVKAIFDPNKVLNRGKWEL